MRRTAWCSIEDQFSSRGCTSRSQTKESALWSDTQQRCVTGVGGLFSDVLQEEAIRELEGDSVCKRVSVGGPTVAAVWCLYVASHAESGSSHVTTDEGKVIKCAMISDVQCSAEQCKCRRANSG